MNLSIIGTGFISRRFLQLVKNYNDVSVDHILTRRPINSICQFPYANKLTNNIEDILSSDIVLEVSNDANYAYPILLECAKNGIKIVTYDTELHTSYGSNILRHTKFFTEALGDQPGCFAKLRNTILDMDMTPVGYINYKRYMNHNPDLETMKYYSHLTGNSLAMTVSATDGTKVSFETCLIANAFDLDINQNIYSDDDDMEQIATSHSIYFDATKRGMASLRIGLNLSKGICVISTIDKKNESDLNYLGLVKNGMCIFEQNYHLCHYEIIDTIRDLYYNNKVLLNNNSSNTYTVYAKSKSSLKKGTIIKNGIGGFEVRGELRRTSMHTKLIPIVLLNNCILKQDIEYDNFIRYEDVEKI